MARALANTEWEKFARQQKHEEQRPASQRHGQDGGGTPLRNSEDPSEFDLRVPLGRDRDLNRPPVLGFFRLCGRNLQDAFVERSGNALHVDRRLEIEPP